MVSVQAQAIIDDMRAQMGAPLPPLAEERAGWEAWSRQQRLPEGSLVSGVELNGIACEWVERAESEREMLLLVHGGGYSAGSPLTHRRFAAGLALAGGRRVLVPEYRLAPEEPYPAGLDDIVAVYAALIEDGLAPEEIAFLGDSAGGGLALASLIKLKELGAPLPAALVTMCGWMDLTLSAASLDAHVGFPGVSRAELERAADWYLPIGDRRDPLVSPVHADLSGLPPLLVQAAGNDILLDDSVILAARAREAGVDVTLTVTPGMWHGFQTGDCPEARAAVEEAVVFVNNRGPAGAA